MSSIDDVLRGWDGELAVSCHDERTDTWMFIAVHSTKLGPAGGGTRMKSYAAPADALRDACLLGRAMTLKMAVAGLPMGGGKSVLAVPRELSAADRRHLLLRHAHNVEVLKGSYRTGPDMNTTSDDMDVLGEVTEFAFGRSEARGGSGSSAPDTAVGCFEGIKASVAHVFGSPDLAGRSVLVQGVGAVGEPLVRTLHAAGANVLVSDVSLPRVSALYDELGVEVLAPESVIGAEVDVYAPCATGGVIDAAAIPRLRCRIVAGAANNPLGAPEDGELLSEAGILYAPDFVINGGGAIHLIGYEALKWSKEQVDAGVVGIGATLTEIYARADAEGISTETAAERLAYARLGQPAPPA